MPKNILLFFFLVSTTLFVYAQKNKFNYWRVGVNPLALAEPHLSIGPCVSYRFNERLELWTEASFIFANSYLPTPWANVKGFRYILQPRYFTGDEENFFIAPELRIKEYGFINTSQKKFINTALADTSFFSGFKETQFLIGGSVVIGMQITLSKKKHISMDLTLGIGAKHRVIKRKNVPEGYESYFEPQRGYGLGPHYEYNDDGTVYIPLCARFLWRLK